MKILVCVKRVPDPNQRVNVCADGSGIDDQRYCVRSDLIDAVIGQVRDDDVVLRGGGQIHPVCPDALLRVMILQAASFPITRRVTGVRARWINKASAWLAGGDALFLGVAFVLDDDGADS